MRNIAFILPELGIGGAQDALFRIANSVSNTENVCIISLSQCKNARVLSSIPDYTSKVTFYQLGSKRVAFSIVKLILLCKTLKIDYMVSSCAHANIICIVASFFLGVKVIAREDNVIFNRKASSSENILQKYFLILMRVLLYGHAYKIIAVSSVIETELKSSPFMLSKNLMTLANPCGKFSEYYFKQRYSFLHNGQKDNINFLAVGRLDDQKDFLSTIKAFDLLYSTYPDLKPILFLDIYGSGPLRSVLEDTISTLNLNRNIRLKGYSSDLLSEYPKYNFFIATPLWEGFGMAIVEAMFHSIPIILAKSPGGAVDLVSKYSKSIICNHNINDISKAILTGINYEFKNNTRFIKQDCLYLKSFDTDYVSRRYLDLMPL